MPLIPKGVVPFQANQNISTTKTFTTSAFQAPYLINGDNPSIEYSRFIIAGTLTKTDQLNKPTKLEFQMVPYDLNDPTSPGFGLERFGQDKFGSLNAGTFVKLVRGNYIVFQSTTYPNWFTGYIINDPELKLLGTLKGQAYYGYSYTAMSDEYLLNLKPLGIVSPFLNMTQGNILKNLVEMLCPQMYNTDNIQDGQMMPRYQVNPTDKFLDVVSTFATDSQYIFSARAGVLYFDPIDSVDFSQTIDGNDRNFTPANLTLSPTSDPIINDATVLGQIEPQSYVTEYFAGDGATGSYDLMFSPFGVDSTDILTDDFSGTTINTDNWTLYDYPDQFIQLANGFVNLLGASGTNTFDVHLDSAFPIPLEGSLRITQGQWDFLPDTSYVVNGIRIAVIGGIWTQEPNINLVGCVYGLLIYGNGSSSIVNCITVVNGQFAFNQVLVIDTTLRYVIRTNIVFDKTFRSNKTKSFLDDTGTLDVSGSEDVIPSSCSINTLMTSINISTGLPIDSFTFTDTIPASANIPHYALYIPIANNLLHATFSNITVSVPIQGSLSIAPTANVGDTNLLPSGRFPRITPFISKKLGQNELDTLDGDSPDATIADTVTGQVAASSLLGTPQYNTATASLEFFKDSVALVSTTPEQGCLVQLQYREAGAALGRVVNVDSINTESAAWKDDGVRAIVKTDFTSLPRTSDECEAAAAAYVGQNCYQHYEGSYVFPSEFRTASGEPVSGTVMKFKHLPVQFPKVKAEQVTQVTTTFDSRRPIERFTHTANFGVIDRIDQLLTKYYKPTDVFLPVDSIETPVAYPDSQVALSTLDYVTNYTFMGMDDNSYYFSILETPPVDGGFEVRSSDTGWGVDNGNNFIARLGYSAGATAYNFNIPRNNRSRAVYIKKYDGRNIIANSETFSSWGLFNATGKLITGVGPDGDYSSIYILTNNGNGPYSLGSSLLANTTGGVYTFTIDVNIPQGMLINIEIADPNNPTLSSNQFQYVNNYWAEAKTITGTGSWQRVSITSNVPSTSNNSIQAVVTSQYGNVADYAESFAVTKASVEFDVHAETVYAKTNAFAYGALSRFSGVARVNMPGIPPPVASVSIAVSGNLDDINTVVTGSGETGVTSYVAQVDAAGDPTNTAPTPTTPQLTIVLPALQLDVFGIEIRDHDNATVLYRQNITAAGFALAVSLNNPAGLSNLSYFVYTYNVYGEYSTTAQITTSIFVPPLETLTINYANHTLNWTIDDPLGPTGYTFKIEIDLTSGSFANIISTQNVVGTTSAPLIEGLAGESAWYRVTPFTSFGTGTSLSVQESYSLLPLDSFLTIDNISFGYSVV